VTDRTVLPPGVITTVGHGTLDEPAFAALLLTAGIDEVVDVRRFPGSRRHPHFGKDVMTGWLASAGVEYRWISALGGRRRPSPQSPNVGLRHPQFRAYADHMATDEFADGVSELLAGPERRQAVLCSESVWWRCHRRLLADHLVLVVGRAVEHLFHDGRRTPHPVTDGARVGGGVVTNPAS
jgi:uncharacterized protein (DUF488 family)